MATLNDFQLKLAALKERAEAKGESGELSEDERAAAFIAGQLLEMARRHVREGIVPGDLDLDEGRSDT